MRRTTSGVLVAVACLWVSQPAEAQAPPPNDNFANATVLSGTAVTVTGTNVGATAEPGEPAHAGQLAGLSVWWRWTAPADGAVTIDTCDSDFDTVLAVYTGASVEALTPIKSDDDRCDVTSSVTFLAQVGQVYSIAVDGVDEEEGVVRLLLQPTLRLDVTKVARRGAIDATRFLIQVPGLGDDFPDPPQLVFQRAGRRITIDLELDNELDSETRFRFTFQWACERRGAWRWTVTVRRDGERVSQEGSFTVPRCVKSAWFVSVGKVRSDFAGDFPSLSPSELRCSPVGPTRGSLAHTWRCVIVKPGFSCTGSFTFRYTQVVQGGDVVERTRRPSGSVTCRG